MLPTVLRAPVRRLGIAEGLGVSPTAKPVEGRGVSAGLDCNDALGTADSLWTKEDL